MSQQQDDLSFGLYSEILSTAKIGICDWNIQANTLFLNPTMYKILGYAEGKSAQVVTWENMIFADDLPLLQNELNKCIQGETTLFEIELRVVCKCGFILWGLYKGKVLEFDNNHNPLRLAGAFFEISQRKKIEQELKESATTLAYHKEHLEAEVKKRTTTLLEQDKILWTVNEIARELIASHRETDFSTLVQKCLRSLGEVLKQNRIYIWKDVVNEDNVRHCTQVYEWVNDIELLQNNSDFVNLSYEALPSFRKAIDYGWCLNSLVCHLSPSERNVLEPQGIKSILIAPININGKIWGFIGIDNCVSERLFTEVEENILRVSGFFLASAIERKENETAISAMEEYNELMLNATPIGCQLWDKDFNVLACNDAVVRLFRLSNKEEFSIRFNDLSAKYQPCGHLSSDLSRIYIQKAFENGYQKFEWLHYTLDGTPLPAEITLVRIKYKNEHIVAGYTHDLREVKAMLAELHKVENDLRIARDEALLSSKAKTNFLANMSHEIRTPMNAISGLAELIFRESRGRQAAEHAIAIKTACNNLLTIINDILDISKIESGKLEIFNAEYDLASLLNDAINIVRLKLGEKQLVFLTNIDCKLPGRMIGDEIRIKQILLNLLSNAIKFTPQGYIALNVSGTIEDNTVNLVFSVEDTGIGLREDEISSLFVEFERVNTTKNRDIEGTGLGLAISKRLCEMMNGSIQVKSQYEVGSTFTVTLPQACEKWETLAYVHEPKKILLYETRTLYMESIKDAIINLGNSCSVCLQQTDFYEYIEKNTFDYIFTSSFHLKKIKEFLTKKQVQIPIIVFINNDETFKAKDVYTLFLPVSCMQIAHILNNETPTDYEGNTKLQSYHFIAPEAKILIVDDNSINLEVAAGLMEPYLFHIDTAINGIEAIKKVKSNHYDLVFMDHMMPEMDGIDATNAIRKLEGDYFQKLPIIALTANAIVGTKEVFLREGMNDFLAKPIEINKLGAILSKWLPASKQRQPSAEELLNLSENSIPTLKKQGNEKNLKVTLKVLRNAVDLVNINQIENITLKLLEFEWKNEIINELLAIKKAIEVYDYNTVVLSLIKIENILEEYSFTQ